MLSRKSVLPDRVVVAPSWRDINDAALFQPEESLATVLDERGYWTAIVGKYLNRSDGLADKTPPGWDRVAITSGGYWTDWWVDGQLEPHSDRALTSHYSTDVLRDKAIAFLQTAPAAEPVFMFLTPFATHAGGKNRAPEAAPRHAIDSRCMSVGRYKSPAYAEEDISDKPAWVARIPMGSLDPGGWPLRDACRALLSVDEMLGAVRAELMAQGRLANTLFVLVADNGMGWGDHRLAGKTWPYATHLPLWLRWDAAMGAGPSIVTAHASMVDLAPTLAAAAGTTLGPFPTGQASPDGVSLLNTMLTGVPPERDALLEEHDGWAAVRTTDGLWQYVEYDTGEKELYDLTVDPWRLQNVAGDEGYAPIESSLAHRLAAFL